MSEEDDYGLSPTKEIAEIDPPAVDYRPPRPKSYSPKIGLIGTGGISEFQYVIENGLNIRVLDVDVITPEMAAQTFPNGVVKI